MFDWSLVVGFKWAALEGSKRNPKPLCSYKSSQTSRIWFLQLFQLWLKSWACNESHLFWTSLAENIERWNLFFLYPASFKLKACPHLLRSLQFLSIKCNYKTSEMVRTFSDTPTGLLNVHTKCSSVDEDEHLGVLHFCVLCHPRQC